MIDKIEIRIIKTITELRQEIVNIQFLLDKHNPQLYFYEPEWQIKWLENISAQSKIRIILAYQDKKLVGMLPLCISDSNRFGVKMKTLEIIGAKQSGWTSIFAVGDKPLIFNAFINGIKSIKKEWDIATLQRIRTKSDMKEFCRILKKDNYLFTQNYMASVYGLNNYTNFEEYIKSRKHKLVQNYKRYKRNLEKEGVFEFISCKDMGKETTYDYLLKVAKNSWQGIRNESIYSADHQNKNLPMFHKSLIFADQTRMQPFCFFIRLDGKPISYRYGFLLNNKYTSYSIEYDLNYKKFAPGVVLHYMTIEYLMNMGVREIDFGIGDGRHKDEWTDWSDDLYTINIYQFKFKSYVLYLLQKLWNFKKSYLQKSEGND